MITRVLKSELLRHVSLMFVATSLVNVLNLAFQLWMVRALPPESFATLTALMAMFMILAQPGGVAQMVMTKFVAQSVVRSGAPQTQATFLASLRWIAGGAGLVFAVMLVGSRLIADFLRIDSATPVLLTGTIMFLAIINPAVAGALQGLQRFGYLASSIVAGGLVKLLAGIALVALGLDVVGALNSIAIGILASLSLSAVLLGKAFRRARMPFAFTEGQAVLTSDEGRPILARTVFKHFLPFAVVNLCIAVLTSVDLVLVKHFFSAAQAGQYSVAQMAGKVILFFPGAVTIVMFPKVAALSEAGEDTRRLLRRSLFLAAALTLGPVLLALISPSVFMKLLVGRIIPESIPLVRMFVVVMSTIALTNVLWMYQLAVNRSRFLVGLAGLSVLQIILISVFHQSLEHVLYVMLAISGTAFAHSAKSAGLRGSDVAAI